MKKYVLLLPLLIALTVHSYAQRFEGGLLGGFNGTQVEGDRYK